MLDTADTADVIDQGAFFACKVTEVEHYTDDLFRFRTARPASLRFRPGEFLMIGLQGEKKPILRAYSVASPSWDDTLEFYSIKVADGALTSKLRHIQPGDRVLVGRKPKDLTGPQIDSRIQAGGEVKALTAEINGNIIRKNYYRIVDGYHPHN